MKSFLHSFCNIGKTVSETNEIFFCVFFLILPRSKNFILCRQPGLNHPDLNLSYIIQIFVLSRLTESNSLLVNF